MSYLINVTLIVGFILLDWLRFHDILKAEVPTGADWLTLMLSLLVFYAAVTSLLAELGQRKITR